jgi:hypothetical protein
VRSRERLDHDRFDHVVTDCADRPVGDGGIRTLKLRSYGIDTTGHHAYGQTWLADKLTEGALESPFLASGALALRPIPLSLRCPCQWNSGLGIRLIASTGRTTLRRSGWRGRR